MKIKIKAFLICCLFLFHVLGITACSNTDLAETTISNEEIDVAMESEFDSSSDIPDSTLMDDTVTEVTSELISETAACVSEDVTENSNTNHPSENTECSEPPAPSDTSAYVFPSTGGALCVNGTQLTDRSGNPVQLKGISTHGLSWFPQYVNEECFKELRQNWNVNVIRLALYTAEYNGYCTGGNKEELKNLIRNGVEYAKNQDMYVIIDWHILSDQTPMLYKEEAKAFFTKMSSEFASYDHVLYEICNEPNGSTSWPEIKSYAEEVIGTIRSNDEDAVIIVGTPNWSQYVDQAAADPITEYNNIMYALHFYATTHGDSLQNTMVDAIEAGLPVFVSEYGICDASGSGAIDYAQAEKWIETMNTYGVSYVAWNLANKDETSSILKSSCTKTSGFTDEDLSESGKWVYEMLRK